MLIPPFATRQSLRMWRVTSSSRHHRSVVLHAPPTWKTFWFSSKTSSNDSPPLSAVDITAQFEENLDSLESTRLHSATGCRQGSISFLAHLVERGDLNLFPEYQRSYVWKPQRASRLIVTILCKRFMPPLVLHETEPGRFDVVDGKQRLTSLLGWYMNREGALLPGNAEVRKRIQEELPRLQRLDKLDESYESLNGLTFDDLSSERKRAYEGYIMNYMVIPKEASKKDVFGVYEDINSGGQHLSLQQLRRSVYPGPYMRMIDKVRDECEDFQEIFHPKPLRGPEKDYRRCDRDSDGELILRAFSFRRKGHLFKPPLKFFLNNELAVSVDYDKMETREKAQVDRRVAEYNQEFQQVMRIAREVFGRNAFWKKRTPRTTKALSLTLWDAKYAAIAELLDKYKEIQFIKAKDRILADYKQNIKAGLFATDDEKTTRTKFVERKEELKRIIKQGIDEAAPALDNKRTFPSEWKLELFEDQQGLCGICNQTMDQDRLDDDGYAHIDHIFPHSLGGATERDNAQLTHRTCNLSKGTKIQDK